MRTTFLRVAFGVLILGGLGFAASACEKDAGDKINDAANDAGDAVKDAAHDTKDAVKDATN